MLDRFANKTVCLKYRLDPQIKGRYIYCLSPPTEDQIIDTTQSFWQTIFYGEVRPNHDKNLKCEGLDKIMIDAIGSEGFWENFIIQTAKQGTSQWREIIGIAKVKEPFKVNLKVYTKVIDNIFKKDVSVTKKHTPLDQ